MDLTERICKCRKCKYEWVARGKERPASCASWKCRTKAWDREPYKNGGQQRAARKAEQQKQGSVAPVTGGGLKYEPLESE